MNCKNCGAALKFNDSGKAICEYCGSEFYKEEYGLSSNISKKQKYDKQYLRIAVIEKTIYSFSTYKALVQYMPPIRFEKRKIIEDKDEFIVDFDVHEKYIDIISDIPERFEEEDIKEIIIKALINFSKPFKKGIENE